ncbi:uncharacterized protein [Haliotis asinina]|uniref:uncharacterized protein n=1 Tax=Haliotis asinina TaxID=109174 RepID=UPI003531F639
MSSQLVKGKNQPYVIASPQPDDSSKEKSKVIKLQMTSEPQSVVERAGAKEKRQKSLKRAAVYLNGQLVSSANNHYGFKSIMKALLNFGAEAKSTQLTSQLFYKDTSEDNDDIESTDPVTGANKGLSVRGSFIALSQEMTMSVCRLKVNPALILAHNTLFESSSNALYPFIKSDVKVTSIPVSQLTHTIDNVSNPIANQYTVGFVDSSSFNGKYDGNPFNFQSSMIKTVNLYVNGVSVPGTATPADDADTYLNMFDNLKYWRQDRGNFISREEFLLGSALCVYHLDDIGTDYLNLVKSGNVRLEIEFKSAVTETLSCVIMSERNSIIEIDKARNVYIK